MADEPVPSPDYILQLDSRRKIYELIGQKPGNHLRALARALELPLGTTLYHLDCLVKAGIVTVRYDGRYKRYFQTNGLGRREKDIVSVLHRDVPRRIFRHLLSSGRSTQREMAKALGVSRSTVSFHVSNLDRQGFLRRFEKWPENEYELQEAELVRSVLKSHPQFETEG